VPEDVPAVDVPPLDVPEDAAEDVPPADIPEDSAEDVPPADVPEDTTTDAADTSPECVTATMGDLVINEILADPPLEAAGDANADGTRHHHEDEFIEIVAAGTAHVSLEGVTITVGGKTRHTFADLCLGPGEAVVVFGGGEPALDLEGVAVLVAGTAFILSNSGTTVALNAADGAPLDLHAYGGEGANDSSLTRSPDVTGSFAVHDTVAPAGAAYSPGRCVNGEIFPGCLGD